MIKKRINTAKEWNGVDKNRDEVDVGGTEK